MSQAHDFIIINSSCLWGVVRPGELVCPVVCQLATKKACATTSRTVGSMHKMKQAEKESSKPQGRWQNSVCLENSNRMSHIHRDEIERRKAKPKQSHWNGVACWESRLPHSQTEEEENAKMKSHASCKMPCQWRRPTGHPCPLNTHIETWRENNVTTHAQQKKLGCHNCPPKRGSTLERHFQRRCPDEPRLLSLHILSLSREDRDDGMKCYRHCMSNKRRW